VAVTSLYNTREIFGGPITMAGRSDGMSPQARSGEAVKYRATPDWAGSATASSEAIPQGEYDDRMKSAPFSASGRSFGIHEWRGSGPATLHVHHSDDEAWHVLEGELTFRYAGRTETAGPGMTVFVAAGVPHTYTAADNARYLIVLTPRLSALIAALQADRDYARQKEIYQRFDSELLE